MRKAISLSAALASLVVAGTAGAADAEPCHYSAPRNAELDAAALKSLLINLGPTDAHVQGVAGLTRIEVRGTACASNPQWLDDLRIDTARSGSEVTVTARTGDHDNSFGPFGFSRYAYLKLTVSVPPALAVAIHSGSGDVVAGSLASLDFRSGSGDVVVADVVGNLQIGATGSGDVSIHSVKGTVNVPSKDDD